MLILRTVSSFALLIGLAAVMTFVPAGNRASAAICPQFLAKYCVVEKAGFRQTMDQSVLCQGAGR